MTADMAVAVNMAAGQSFASRVAGRQNKGLSIDVAGLDDVVFKSTVRVHTAMDIQIVNIECHIAYQTIMMHGVN